MANGSGADMPVGTDMVGESRNVVSAVFTERQAAESAIHELRDLGIPASNISVIARNEDQQSGGTVAGVDREEIGDEGLAYRASSELPNYEDLPTTVAEQIGDPIPTGAGAGVSSDEPLGGSGRLGLSRDSDMVRRNEAETNADEDIYTDFPGEPGGVNPNSPAAASQSDTLQEPAKNRTPATGTAAVGAGIGGLGGLLVGLGVLAVPGIGPILAAGPLAGAIGGLIAGGAAGGLVGGLSSIGVPEEYARDYAARIEQGHTLISVRTDNLTADAAERVLVANGGEHMH